MIDRRYDSEDDEIAALAVAALNAAQRLAMSSGEPIVIVENRQLVRIESGKRTVLMELPPRQKVESRVKRATK